MSSLLKDVYSKDFFSSLSGVLGETVPGFDKDRFIKNIFDKSWQQKELKQRMKHISLVLHSVFPNDFEKTAGLLVNIITKLREKNIKEAGIEFMFLPDYVETYGIAHFEVSVKTIEFITQFTSCEFAVRPFIIKYGAVMIRRMQQWSLHENHHVRRLASEGSRPRLPWAMALPELKKNPAPILPLLENLKNDPLEYVRRSVANSLNDISKDHPDVVIGIARKWKGHSKETDALIKHGCRTLLKSGNAEILKYFGLAASAELKVENFKIHKKKVPAGGSLEFSFSLHNTGRRAQTLRLEYGIYYLRQNGRHSKKVFKISERELPPNEKINIERRQSFRPITTRQFYAGTQKISLIINGQEREFAEFVLAD